MEPLDLRDFIWQSKETKVSYMILALTTYEDEHVVVYREAKNRSKICVDSISNFVKRCEATYQL